MFENIDELIEVNLKLLFASKSQFMMRINFKDEYGFNLKNSKVFAEILEHKGLIVLEKTQGFRCDLTDVGRQICQSGGWIKYKQAIESLTKLKDLDTVDSQVKMMEQSLVRKIIVASIIMFTLCLLITLFAIKLLNVY